MALDRKGINAFIFIGMMLGLCVILLALAFAPVLRDSSQDARNSSSSDHVGLDCANASISNFDKASCLYVDYMPPLFIGLLIAIGGALVVARYL